MAKDYSAYRKALQEQYDEKENERRTELENTVQEGEREKEILAAEREQGARQAYVREQRGLHEVSARAAEAGENGGREENNRRRIRSAYEWEMANLRNVYGAEANAIDARLNAEREETMAGIAKDRAEYLAKLSKLAAEEKAAAEAAAAKAAKPKNPTQSSGGKGETSGNKKEENKTEEKTESAQQENSQIHVVKAGSKAFVFANGARVSNEVVWDGSGRVMISVSGKKMTPEEAEQGVLDGTVQRFELENGRSFYQLARGYGAEGGDRVLMNQEKKDQTSILTGILAFPALRQKIWEDSAK